MPTSVELLREHKYRELWQRCCGFVDLSLQDFMLIQRRLLLEQIELLEDCELGRHVMRGARPRTVEEFREEVPLTTYADYAPYLWEQMEDVLPARPVLWQRTSGVSGEHQFKWAPVTQRMYQEMGTVAFAMLIFATCKGRYDINLEEGERMLYALAPPPYATGCWGRVTAQELPIAFLPPLEEAEAMSFEDRLAKGLRQGLFQGIDLVFGLPSVLVTLGEQIGQWGQQKESLLPLLTKPTALFRVARAMLKSRLMRRPIRPRDLWSLRGVATAARDASLYRQRIQELWGRTPLDVYGSTEGLVTAMQTWDYNTMTFLPNLNFLEFIPEAELVKAKFNPDYQPRTKLLNEVEPDENYEVVVTNFLGGAFVRYRLGDIVTIVARRNEKLNIDIPQMLFYSKADDIIDLAGFAKLTEKTLWQAVEQAGLPSEEWVARREAHEDIPILHIYLELADNGHHSAEDLTEAIHRQLKALDRPYSEIEELLGLKPLKVTLLPRGAFRNYIDRQRAMGSDLAHLKPRRINPSDTVLATLLQEVPEHAKVPVA
ncbi:GH3 auxin-responsive promoter family protein [Chloroflexota bacterium]